MKKFLYLIELQYLGFRYHGWQFQPNVKTVQFMLDQTLRTVLGHDNFKTLGASRTDAMVSAHHHMSQLFTEDSIDSNETMIALNRNLPQDIRILNMSVVDENFRIINPDKFKEYLYIFSFGEKFHPFCAPFMAHLHESLDIELMMEGAKMFEGVHNFYNYCHKPTQDKTYIREIQTCEVVENDYITASFFPKKSYIIKFVGAGFLRNQVRMMSGALFNLGQHKINLADLEKSLVEDNIHGVSYIAPATGLHLNNNNFQLE